jgi:predicted ATPase
LLVLQQGQLIGDKYRVERLIGRGGMGAVYRATNEALKRAVALKVLASGAEDPALVERFHHEAVAASRVRHRAIVEVYDAGTHDGTPWIAMELLEGEALAAWLKRGRPAAGAVVEVLLEVLAGLAAAHDAGIVHRDLKPDNVFLSFAGGRVQPKILDFGIAKLAGQRLTQSGVVLGTAAYLAPEQARGDADVDARADLWALGVMAFEALAGEPPWSGPHLPALVLQILNQPPRSLRQLAPGTPDALVAVIERCLSRDRGARPPDARSLARDLAAAMGASSDNTVALAPEMMSVAQTVAAPSGALVAGHAALPPEDSSFVGRAADLERIGEAFARGARLVTLVGAGGTGKTRLALRWARAGVGLEPSWVRFADLSQARSLSEVLDAVARAFSLSLASERAPSVLSNELAAALEARGPTWLVLDNFEQVVEHAPATVGVWLRVAPQLRALVTSRAPLRLHGEVVVDVGALPEEDARLLFLERARAAARDFALGTGDDVLLRDLLQRLDCMPLAIELAATRASVLSVRQIADRLSNRFRLLSGGARDAPTKRTALRATIDWSWELLDAVERDAFAQCAVFRGGFDLDAAELVVDLGAHDDAPWTLDVLQSLAEKSLLRTSRAGGQNVHVRFDMYESVREYAAERLAARPDVAACVARHEVHFLNAAGAWNRDAFGPAAASARERLTSEQANLLSIADRGGDGGIRALLALEPVLASRAPRLFVDRLDAALATPIASASLRAEALIARASSRLSWGDQASAEADLGEAGRLAEAAPEKGALWAKIQTHRARMAFRRGQLAEALAAVEEAIAFAAAAGAKRAEGLAWNTAGLVHWHAARLDEAVRASEKILSIARSIHDRDLESLAVGSLGLYASQTGRLDEATRRYIEALAIERELGNRYRLAVYANNIGFVHHQLGEIIAARTRYEESIAIAREAWAREIHAVALGNTGIVDFEEGDLEAGRGRLTEAIERLVALGEHRHRGCFLGWLGVLRAAAGDVEAGRAALDEGARMLGAVGDRPTASALEILRGFIDLAEGHAPAAFERADSKRGSGLITGESDYERLAERLLRKALAAAGAARSP